MKEEELLLIGRISISDLQRCHYFQEFRIVKIYFKMYSFKYLTQYYLTFQDHEASSAVFYKPFLTSIFHSDGEYTGDSSPHEGYTSIKNYDA